MNAPLVPVPAVVLHVIERSFARGAEPGISPVIVLSITDPLLVMAGIYCVELRPMMDQKFLKIPQMGDVVSNFRCDRQITAVIRAHVR